MSVSFQSRMHEGMPVLELIGKVKGEGDERLQKCLEKLRKKNYPKIIIDITQTDFIDSHGLGVIIYFYKILIADKQRLILVNSAKDPASYISRLFSLTGLDKVLTIVDSVEAA